MMKRWHRVGPLVLVVAMQLLAGCAGGGSGRGSRGGPQVVPPIGEAAIPREHPAAFALPVELPATGWRVQLESVVDQRGDGASLRQTVTGVVHWALTRQPSGALRGRGTVETFSVRSNLDSGVVDRGRSGSTVWPLLLDLLMDSTVFRVTTRPLLPNECDRVEAVAAGLAREVLLRIPDGVTVGAIWRDSAVTFVCRDGVPMTVITVTQSRLTELSARRGVVERRGTVRVAGSGGPAFRAMEIQGEGTTNDRVTLDLTRGLVDRLRGERSLTLRITPPVATGRPRAIVAMPHKTAVVVTQRVTTTVDRLPN